MYQHQAVIISLLLHLLLLPELVLNSKINFDGDEEQNKLEGKQLTVVMGHVS